MDIGYTRPRGLIPPDLRLVRDAAAILRLREFDLFRAAWQDWFGRPPDDKALERVFVAYLFHQHVPHWLRHFARRVMQDSQGGKHSPGPPIIADYPRHEPLAEPGEGYVTALYIAAVVICVMLAT